MIITIYTDASFKNRNGAWAACIMYKNDVLEYSGVIERYCHSINYAELYAVYEATKLAIEKWDLDHITLKTDSMSVVRWLGLSKKPRNKATNKVYKAIKNLLHSNNVSYDIEHVKGHSTNYYNNLCDSNAKTICKQ